MKTELYHEQQRRLPSGGQHLIADHDDDTLIVYQAFKPAIADYAVRHQAFGGPHYKHGRMTWIKPGFMWMMFRAGWATKVDQERILRLTIKRSGWEEILRQAVHSSFKADIYDDEQTWKNALANSGVRLQWDPDHDPEGNKLERKAIQIGLKGKILEAFHADYLLQIEDITPFVTAQRENRGAKLLVPIERVMEN
jgi:hypothetical protein